MKFSFISLLLIINFFHFIVWLFIKFLPKKLVLKLIKFSNFKLINLNLKNNYKYKKLIKRITNKSLQSSKNYTCLSRAITARVLYNIIGVENNLKLGIVLKSNGEKEPHAWLEDKITGEELTRKFANKNITTFDINL